MIRMARAGLLVLAIALWVSATAFAQPSRFDTSRGYAQFDIAATLGHTSDKALGAEAGYDVRPEIAVFFEGGHIGNAASADLQSGASRIASAGTKVRKWSPIGAPRRLPTTTAPGLG